MSVDDHYQSVFPPDVNAVYDHGKRDVSIFPRASGRRFAGKKLYPLYLMVLDHLGLGQIRQAEKCFGEVLHQDPSHTGAHLHLRLFDILGKVKAV